MIGMARGLIASPHTKTNLVMTSIFRTGLQRKCPQHLINLSRSILRLQRFLCSFSQQDGPTDMQRYREAFARRMNMAGLKPHHRLAIGVSGGPDSMALCVLAAMWKEDGCRAVATEEGGEFVDGLVGIVVDHGLRAESGDEAILVRSRVMNMGIRCEVAHCEWPEGRPKHGHLQEAARDKRYQHLQDVCIKHNIGVLLIAHHADDQAELFILRLSRCSGVLGLSGTAFVSQLFAKHVDNYSDYLRGPGTLLVRPLLDFSKEDMYQICKGANQEWVEDPTNQNILFARNRIRMNLSNLSSSVFRTELLAVISACRKTRQYVDRICMKLINQAVVIMPEGYVVIDLKILEPSNVNDVILSKFLTMVLQFISQRCKPVRGSASKLLLDYIRISPCKTCVTAAGCYLCPSPGSKGSRVLVCCSVDHTTPLKMEVIQGPFIERHSSISSEIQQIVENARSSLDSYVASVSDDQYLGLKSSLLDPSFSGCVISEAKRLGIISHSTYDIIVSFQNHESEKFKPKAVAMLDHDLKDEEISVSSTHHRKIYPGQVCYFMSRYLIKWNHSMEIPNSSSSDANERNSIAMAERKQDCASCVVDHDYIANVRCMVDSDWLYLAHLLKIHNVESNTEPLFSAAAAEKEVQKTGSWLKFVKLSAQRSLLSLKSIPASARRSMPVLVDSRGLLLSIPSVGFQHCPCLVVFAEFKPRVPITGGHSSFL